LGCFPRKRPFGLRRLHAFNCAKPDEVGLELSDHRKDVEQQPSDGVGWVVGRATERKADLSSGELVGDRPGVRQ
jgi:hypothetical protein